MKTVGYIPDRNVRWLAESLPDVIIVSCLRPFEDEDGRMYGYYSPGRTRTRIRRVPVVSGGLRPVRACEVDNGVGIMCVDELGLKYMMPEEYTENFLSSIMDGEALLARGGFVRGLWTFDKYRNDYRIKPLDCAYMQVTDEECKPYKKKEN